MSNEYKEWLKEQTFESLTNDNLRIKLELKTAKEENEKLKELRDYQHEELKRSIRSIEYLTQQNKQLEIDIELVEGQLNNVQERYDLLYQQNKQMKEALEKMAELLTKEEATYDNLNKNIWQAKNLCLITLHNLKAQQALNEVNNEK